MAPFVDRLEREVCATPEEFARGLQSAFPDQVSGGPLRFSIAALGAGMEIDLTPGSPRRIAGLTLPVLDVRIRFSAGSPERQRALIEYLDRATQRGGG